MKKLRDNQGETLVEVLASILIASLSVALLFGCAMASSSMDRQAAKLDEEHYAALTAAEKQDVVVGATEVEITNPANSMSQKLAVSIYGGAELYSYARIGP